MTKAEIFIEKYKELEYVVSEKYNLNKNDSPIAYLERLKEYNCYHKEISYCRETRNFLQHETKIDDEFAIIPSDEMIELITKLIKLVSNPPLCIEIAIKKDKIFYKHMNDNVLASVKALSHKQYTHIPLLDNGMVMGVFSKSSLFNYLIDNNWRKIDNSICFRDIKKYIELDSISGEGYVFIRHDAPIGEAVLLIDDIFKSGKRISIIFITENGLSSEPLLGMLTPWNILGY